MGKRSLRRRCFSFSLALCMILTLFPVTTRASVYEGDCGAVNASDVHWAFDDETGVLTITGSGAMADYPSRYNTPWTNYQEFSITSVQIGEGVTSVGDYAFYDSNSLTDISLPSTLKSIGNNAFRDCNYLTSITLPASVKSIGDEAFYYCNYLTSVTLSEGLESIGDSAFNWCDSLASVTIPASVKNLGNCVFYSCDDLASVTLSEGLESIGDSAFAECYKLSSLTIPKSVTYIGGAFPGSLTPTVYFDTYAWRYCVSANISCNVLEGDGKTYTAVGECGENVYWKLDSEGLLTISGNGAMASCDSAYSGPWRDWRDNVKTVEIQSGVTSVSDYAFYGYYGYSYPNLTAVSFPASLISIGSNAFHDCDALTSVTIADSVTSIGDEAFRDCDKLESVTLPNKGASIGRQAFYNCDALTSVQIPASVTEIGNSAFGDCDNLTLTVTENTPGYGYALRENIPFKLAGGDTVYSYAAGGECGENAYWTLDNDGLLSIFGSGAMRDCDSEYDVPWYNWRGSIKTVNIQSGVTSVGANAFYDCDLLTSVTIPDKVTSIGNNAFHDCDALKSIVIADSVTTIGEWAFAHCDALTSVTFPANLVSIGADAFGECYKLSSLALPDKLASIGDSAFAHCDALITVTLPDSVTSVGDSAFWGCDALASLTLSANLEYIGNEAFRYCYSLRNLTIPGKVSTIGTYAFIGCNRLTALTIPATVQTIGEGAFRDCGSLMLTVTQDSGGHVYALSDGVPFKIEGDTTGAVRVGGKCGENVSWLLDWNSGLLEISGSSDMLNNPWSSYNDKIRTVKIGSGVTSICDNAFSESSLASVTLPDGLTSIGYQAFGNCSSLTSVTLPNSVNSIGSYAFQGCSSLTSVALPGKLTQVESYAFYDCNALASVVIPNSVLSIGTQSFYSCDALESVTVPASVLSISDDAFQACPKLVLTVTNDTEGYKYATRANISYNFAGDDTIYRRGSCGAGLGDDVTWILDNSGQMTISGSGAMRDFDWNWRPWSDFREQIKSVAIASGVTSIGAYAFYDCDALTLVTISDSVTAIGNSAFSDCDALESVTVPATVKEIGDSAFSSNNLILTVTKDSPAHNYVLSSHIRYRLAGSDTVYVNWGDCGDNAKWVFTDDNLLKISGSGTMSDWDYEWNVPWSGIRDSVQSVEIDSGITRIGSYAFYQCNNLASVTIPDSVTAIGEWAFYNCDALSDLTLSAKVDEIGNNAFADCGSLVVTVPDNAATRQAISKTGVSHKLTGLETVYRAFGLWGGESSQAWTLESNGILTLSGKGAIIDYENSDATPWAYVKNLICTVIVTDGVTQVGSYAFADCGSLEKAYLPASVKTLGERAFSGNQNLTFVSMEEGLNSIGASAFYECARLTALTAPESVNSIGADAFNTYYYYYSDQPFVLTVYSGSVAEQYAKDNSIPHTTITHGTAAVSGVTLDESSLILSPHQTFYLTASIQPDDAKNKKVTWSSDKPAVASVDERGIVTGLSEGSAKITVTTDDGGKTAFCTVTVMSRIPASVITLSVSRKALKVGGEFDLTATVFPENASDQTVTWSTSNEQIASVYVYEDYYGYGPNTVRVKKEGSGTAVITARSADGSIAAECEILENLAVTGVRIEQKSVVLKQGGEETLSATVLPEGASNGNVSWSCSDPNIAEISEDGKVIGRTEGKATLIATTEEGGFTAFCLVEVTAEVTNVEKIALNREKIPSLEFGTSMQLVATITPANATNQAITWTSSAPEVVAVSDNGVVTALETGKTAVITAMTADGGYRASCVVTVSDLATPTELRVYAPGDRLTAVQGSPLNLDGVLVEAVYGDISEYVSDYSVYDYNRDRVGPQTVVVSYKGKSATLGVTVVERYAEYVFIAQSPDKREYAIGEALDLSGLILQAEYNDQTLETVTDISQMTAVGFRSDTAGTYPVTVMWNDLSAPAFYVTILAESEESTSLTAPKMNIVGYPGGKRVELNAPKGAKIHYECYMLNETERIPSFDSPLYNEPILCTDVGTTVIKAVAILDGETSAITTTRVSVSQAEPPVASHDNNAQLPAGTLVTLRTSTDGATIRYTTNGDEPTTDSPLYSSGVLVNADMTLKAIAVKDGAVNSEMFTASYKAEKRADDAAQSAATISIGSVTSRAGDRASVPVYLFTDGNEKVTFFRFTVSFDRRAFEFASVSPADGISASNLMVSSGANSGSVTVMYDAANGDAIESGEAFTLTLRALDSSEDGEYKMSLSTEDGITIRAGDTRPLVSQTPGVITLSGSHNSQLTGEISLQDDDGNEIAALQDGQDQINVSFSLDPYAPDASQSNGALTAMADVYLVLYDDKGLMLDIQTWNIELKNVWLAFSQVKQVPPEIKGKIDKIKIMILSEDMTPIMAASEL